MEPNSHGLLIAYLEKSANTKIPDEEKQKVIEIFKPRKLNKREYFLKAGDIPDCIAVNLSGLLRCFYIDYNGNDVTKYFCMEGSVLSYLGLVLRKESKYYIEALEDCTLMRADYSAFDKLANDSYFGLKIVKTLLEQTLIYKEERESSFLLETATERYISFIKNYPDIEKRINLGYIASYLGISQVSLSRIRSKLHII